MSLYLPMCRTCHRTKKPIGRDQGLAASYCDTDCEGYAQDPVPPRFWSLEEELETEHDALKVRREQLEKVLLAARRLVENGWPSPGLWRALGDAIDAIDKEKAG